MQKEIVLGRYAGFASRLLAYFVDLGIMAATGIIAAWATVVLLRSLGVDPIDCDAQTTRAKFWACQTVQILTPLVAAAFPTAYGLFFWTTTGQSPGKYVAGVRIVRLNGKPMSVLTAFRRLVGYGISMFTLGLGFLPILVDDRRQALHDKIAGTCVVYSWKSGQSRSTGSPRPPAPAATSGR